MIVTTDIGNILYRDCKIFGIDIVPAGETDVYKRQDLDERFAWCVQLIDNELCIAIHCTTQSGHSPFNNKSFIAAIPIKRLTIFIAQIFIKRNNEIIENFPI